MEKIKVHDTQREIVEKVKKNIDIINLQPNIRVQGTEPEAPEENMIWLNAKKRVYVKAEDIKRKIQNWQINDIGSWNKTQFFDKTTGKPTDALYKLYYGDDYDLDKYDYVIRTDLDNGISNLFQAVIKANGNQSVQDLSGFTVDMTNATTVEQMFNAWEGVNIKMIKYPKLIGDFSKIKNATSLFEYIGKDSDQEVIAEIIDKLSSASLTNMNSFLRGPRKVKLADSVINAIQNLDVSKVTNFTNCFCATTKKETIRYDYLDLRTWDVSSSTNFSSMFRETGIKDIDIDGWDTSKGNDFSYMFSSTNLTEGALNKVVSELDTQNATNINNIFAGNNYLDEIDLSILNLDKVASMSTVINLSKTSLFKLPESVGTLGNGVNNITELFANMKNKDLVIEGFENVKFADNLNTYRLFAMSEYNNIFKIIDKIDFSKINNAGYMFGWMENITDELHSLLPKLKFDPNKTINMEGMFNYANCNGTIDFSYIPAPIKTKSFSSLFNANKNIEYITNIDHFIKIDQTAQTLNISFMFSNCYNLKSVDVGYILNSGIVSDFSLMFYGCNALEYIGDKPINLAKIANKSGVRNMFVGCNSLKSVTFSNIPYGITLDDIVKSAGIDTSVTEVKVV